MPKHNILVLSALFLTVALAFIFRTLFLNTLPYGAHIDEASLGYNAYSIAMTGKDEYGKTLPLVFQAYGDQKMPAYIYATVPFVKLFGLSNFSTRLPGAIAGSILIVFMYLLLRKLKFSYSVSLLGALITATSPWLIMLSRIFGYESGLGLLFLTIGIWASLAVNGSKHQWRYIVIAAGAFSLTWYSYLSYRVITPFIILALVIIFMRTKRFVSSHALLLLILFSLCISPLLFLSKSGTGTARIGQTVETSMHGVIMTIDDDRSICAKSLPKIFCYANSNKIKAYADTLIQGYIRVLSPPYLFVEGDVDAKYVNVDGYGLLSLVTFPLYALGLLYLGMRIFTRTLNKWELFVLLGLIITPIPTLVFGVLQKVRLSGLYPFVLIVCMYGAQYALSVMQSAWQKKALLVTYSILILVFTGSFMIHFLAVHVQKYEITLQAPIARLMQYLGTHDKQTPVYIRSIDEAIVLYAYYNAVDPHYFQKTVVRPPADAGGFSHATDMGNIHRTDINLDEIYCKTLSSPHVLFATNEELVKGRLVSKPVEIIHSRDNVHDLYYIYDTKDVIAKTIDCKYLNRKKI